MKFLIAVDGSSESDETLEYAIGIANALDAEITVCHVVNPALFVEDVSKPVSSLSEAERSLLLNGIDDSFERGLAVLDDAVETALELGHEVEREILYGDPATEISEFAESEGFDAIYVGHRGGSSRRERFLGSVAKGVVDRSTIPVTVVR
jgi:nucleotide-binding universal stress UspA family protein